MVQSVSVGQYQNKINLVQQELRDKPVAQNSHKNPSFGYSEDGPLEKIKYNLALLTNSSVGLVGVNMLLWKMQSFVNGKILVGKINKHFTKNITNNDQLEELAKEMRTKEKLDGKFRFRPGQDGQAYFDHLNKEVVVGKDSFSSLFHEIGHAAIENKTKFLKKLQRGRGNYTWISLALYTMISQRPKNPYDQGQGPISKAKNFLNRNDWVIPLVAFAPELITEAKASKIGIDFLKEKVNEKKLEESVLKNIKKSYLTCFATYLFIPVSIILIDAIRNSANKEVRKHQMY